MYFGKKIAVVIPAHNEAEYLLETLGHLPPWVDFIVVVDDGSRDNTGTLIKKFCDSRLHHCQHVNQRGVGHAVMTGYRKVISLAADIVVTLDADGQMNVGHLRSMIRPIVSGKCDYTKGNRLYRPKVLKKMPLLRLTGNIFFSLMTMLASGCWNIWDSQSGYTAMDARLLKKISFSKIFGHYGFYNDLLIELRSLEARIQNVPVRTIYRNEKSDVRVWRDAPRIFWLLVSRLVRRVYHESVSMPAQTY